LFEILIIAASGIGTERNNYFFKGVRPTGVVWRATVEADVHLLR
jgi:hypothetical protein